MSFVIFYSIPIYSNPHSTPIQYSNPHSFLFSSIIYLFLCHITFCFFLSHSIWQFYSILSYSNPLFSIQPFYFFYPVQQYMYMYICVIFYPIHFFTFLYILGMGELSYFYVYPIFYLSGISMSCFFLLCFYLR